MIQNMEQQKSRQFICACGKNYLSYAALFTHIKQKHEGKAPGPIIRPRSERKRGRPRKSESQLGNLSKQVKQQDSPFSDQLENGILKQQDIHNIKQKGQQNKGHIFLGRGTFAAFTAYRPQLFKSQKSRQKKIMRKISNSSVKEPKLSDLQQAGEGFSFETSESKIEEAFAFYDELNGLNRSSFKKLFCNQDLTPKALSSIFQQSQVFEQISRSNIENVKKSIDMNIREGISLFLLQLKVVFKCESSTKASHDEQSQEMNSQQNIFGVDQAIAITVFFVENFQRENKCTVEEVLNLPIIKLIAYSNQFIQSDVSQEISKHELQAFNLFKGCNPLRFIVFFNNWFTISKAESDLHAIKKREFSPGKEVDQRVDEQNQILSHSCLQNEDNGCQIKESPNENEVEAKMESIEE